MAARIHDEVGFGLPFNDRQSYIFKASILVMNDLGKMGLADYRQKINEPAG